MHDNGYFIDTYRYIQISKRQLVVTHNLERSELHISKTEIYSTLTTYVIIINNFMCYLDSDSGNDN